MKIYLAVYTTGMLVAVLGTPVIARFARSLGAVDAPGARKVHQKAIPRIGGGAIVLAMLAGILPAVAVDGGRFLALGNGMDRPLVLLLTGLLIFAVGFIDDLRGIRARVKLSAQVLAAAILCLFGIRIERVALVSWFTLDLGWFAWPVTIFWIVGITNAVNLIDGLDGLAAGISAVACGVILILALNSGQTVMAVLMFSLLGSLIGFLIFNFHPARIFMGDCGSMFLGFVLAASSVMCATKSHALVGLALPASALGVPIFDTVFSMLRRILERRGMMSPDRDHLHHKLLDMGMRHRHVVLFLYGLTVLTAGLGMFMMITRDASTLIVFACIVLLLVTVFRFVGIVSFRQTISGLRHNIEVAQQARQEQQGFEHSQLLMRQAMSFDDWWTAVCAAAKGMDIANIRLTLMNGEGTSRTLTWECPTHGGSRDVVKMTVPVRHQQAGPQCTIEIAVPVDGSVESAGRRVVLFGRLIDENSVSSLPGV